MIDEKHHFGYYYIVVLTTASATFLTALYLHNQNFLNDILWCWPIVTILCLAALFSLEEIRLINLKRLHDEGIDSRSPPRR